MFHAFLLLDSLGDHKRSTILDLPTSETVFPKITKGLLLHNTELIWVFSVEVEGFVQGDRRVGDDSGIPQAVDRLRVDHQRVEQDDVSHVAGHFMKLITLSNGGLVEAVLVLASMLKLAELPASRNHVRGYALGIVVL